MNGQHTGLMSEAGLPCIADPGHSIVLTAHEKGIRVIPLVGPSSLLLTLMGSGLNGQGFVFHGYLPIKQHERESSLKRIEKELIFSKKSQIFIEAPYRNNALMECILKVCHSDTLLCTGSNLMEPDEMILTRSIAAWKKQVPDLNKRPTVFILGR
jgi:16S rRNA (cytidine1402-2'-O)-methyltransferase